MGSVRTKSLILPLPKSPGFGILPSSQLVLGKDNWEEGKEGGRNFVIITEESSFVPQGKFAHSLLQTAAAVQVSDFARLIEQWV